MPEYVGTILISALTFAVGLLVGLFYKYSDMTAMKKDIANLRDNASILSIVNLVADVRVMKNSIIFTPDFQVKFSTVCSEHDRLREESAKNKDDIITLQEQIKHSRNVGININKVF